ncbi:energy-coupling factor transporter transmembrane component T [Dorea formicigenerans]|uniref:Energy-coupling factor transporter transmembrane protein EcfT n=1 Tax=Dorea formicigenerans TaxID=39486 RepID=A0A564TWE4_9FIRM|nr:energy-coupling factor transporter transmembrane component T [Dorea formicigenerans]VUX11591.1 Energy-coupling factor transporter transmembrane protein EcfT [Dorea formicigenerans]
MKEKKNRGMSLDPRTGILLLGVANIVIFMQKTTMPGNVFIVFFAFTLLFCGCVQSAIGFSVLFICLLIAQNYIFPNAPIWINFLFGIFCNYGRRMLPCFMAGILLIKTNSMHRFILAMRKLHLSQNIIIPITVAVRYFPAMKEEFMHIREAMKLRKVSWSQKIEGYIVPLMLSATKTAEELAQAAVTRGIENPGPKTSAEQLKIKWLDIFITILGIASASAVLLIDRIG